MPKGFCLESRWTYSQPFRPSKRDIRVYTWIIIRWKIGLKVESSRDLKPDSSAIDFLRLVFSTSAGLFAQADCSFIAQSFFLVVP